MQQRFATASFVSTPTTLVIVKTGAGDYFELSVLDKFHAETKLWQFAKANALILTECAGLSGYPPAFNQDSDHAFSLRRRS